MQGYGDVGSRCLDYVRHRRDSDLAQVKKDYEPVLLFPMGVGCILANIPGHLPLSRWEAGAGLLQVLYEAGIANELFPVLIFVAVGAMCDFTPLIRQPYVMLLRQRPI